MFNVIKREENGCLMKVRVMQLNVSVAILVSSSSDQQDHYAMSILLGCCFDPKDVQQMHEG